MDSTKPYTIDQQPWNSH